MNDLKLSIFNKWNLKLESKTFRIEFFYKTYIDDQHNS